MLFPGVFQNRTRTFIFRGAHFLAWHGWNSEKKTDTKCSACSLLWPDLLMSEKIYLIETPKIRFLYEARAKFENFLNIQNLRLKLF